MTVPIVLQTRPIILWTEHREYTSQINFQITVVLVWNIVGISI